MEVLEGAERLFPNNGGSAQIEAHSDERVSDIRKLMGDYGWQFVDRYGINLLFERRLSRDSGIVDREGRAAVDLPETSLCANTRELREPAVS
jgi:hypothetical protein